MVAIGLMLSEGLPNATTAAQGQGNQVHGTCGPNTVVYFEWLDRHGRQEYWLFDSAYPGTQIGIRLQIDLEAGRYFLGTAAFKPSSSMNALVHRMSKSPRDK
jgi:hypothetical protein